MIWIQNCKKKNENRSNKMSNKDFDGIHFYMWAVFTYISEDILMYLNMLLFRCNRAVKRNLSLREYSLEICFSGILLILLRNCSYFSKFSGSKLKYVETLTNVSSDEIERCEAQIVVNYHLRARKCTETTEST